MRNYATHIDPAHKADWLNTVGNKGTGLILQSIKLDYKFVRSPYQVLCNLILIRTQSSL